MSRKAARLLAPILGAAADDVMVGQSTTVNLHQLLATYYEPDGASPRILIDEWCFPSDRYAIESHLRLRGRDPSHDLAFVPYRGGLLDENDLLAAMDERVGLAVLPSVVYRNGQLLDLPVLTRKARERGVQVFWDCSHSVGVVEHAFATDVDFAFGCSYKFLNGGPGAVGWLYVRGELRNRLPGLAGWFGCEPDRQFEMSPAFHPAADAGRFLIGTPHVLSLAPVVGAIELINRAGIANLRAKSLLLTGVLRSWIEHDFRLGDRFGVEVVTPRADTRRGGHLTLKHHDAGKLSRALRARGVIPDFRPPDLLRLCPAPAYTSFAECARGVEILDDILRTGAHHQLPDDHVPVT